MLNIRFIIALSMMILSTISFRFAFKNVVPIQTFHLRNINMRMSFVESTQQAFNSTRATTVVVDNNNNGNEKKANVMKMTEEIAIEVVQSKQATEKSRLNELKQLLNKEISQASTLHNIVNKLETKLQDLDKSLEVKRKDNVIKQGLLQKQVELKNELNLKQIDLTKLNRGIKSESTELNDLEKRILADESFIKSKRSELKKKQEFLVQQTLQKEIILLNKDVTKTKELINDENNLKQTLVNNLRIAEITRRNDELALKRLETTRDNLQKALDKNKLDVDNKAIKVQADNKLLIDLKSKQINNDKDIKQQETLLNKEYLTKLKSLQAKLTSNNKK